MHDTLATMWHEGRNCIVGPPISLLCTCTHTHTHTQTKTGTHDYCTTYQLYVDAGNAGTNAYNKREVNNA